MPTSSDVPDSVIDPVLRAQSSNQAKNGEPVVVAPDASSNPQDPTQPSAPQPATARRLDVKQAQSYLSGVREQLEARPGQYEVFLGIMQDFRTQKVDVAALLERMAKLFCDHPSLVEGFNAYLPPGYHMKAVARAVDSSDPEPTFSTAVLVTTPQGSISY